MKLLLITAILAINAIAINAQCYHQRVHVYNGRNQNVQCRYGYAMRGVHRNGHDNLSGITHLYCCKLKGSGRVTTRNANWVSSFDRAGWSFCPGNSYMKGFYKSSGVAIYNLEYAKCSKRNTNRYKHCYQENRIVGALDRPGWALCRPNYFVVGMWRNTDNRRDANRHKLHRIEYFRCCSQTAVPVRKLCYSNGDPHYRMFNGRRLDNQWRGTFLLGKTSEFTVHTRVGKWARGTAVNTATGVKVKGQKFVFKSPRNNYVVANGRTRRLNNGRNKIAGVVIDKHGSRVIVRAGGEYVQVQTNFGGDSWKKRYGSNKYQNVAVFGSPSNVGFCGAGKAVKANGIFKARAYKTRILATSHCTKKQHVTAQQHCSRRFKTNQGRSYNWCVFDTCRGLRAKWAANWAKQMKYWQNVIKRYRKYRAAHNKAAKGYYKKHLHHLKQMRIHGKAYREHLNARKAHKNAARAHRKAAAAHVKAQLNHLRLRNLHRFHSRKYLRLYRNNKNAAASWRNVVRDAQRRIRNCQRQIRAQRRRRNNAQNRVNFFNNKAEQAYRAAKAHANAAGIHWSRAKAHANAVRIHNGHRNAHNRAAAHHQRRMNYHLRHVRHHERWATINKNRHRSAKNSAKYWSGRINNAQKKIREFIRKRQAEFRKEVKVTKVIRIPSRTCKTVPKYLDSIKFTHRAQARAHALRRCRHSSRNVYYSCVYDHSVGMFDTKREYDQIARLIAANKKRATCYSVGDPHNKPFVGKRFDAYHQTGWKTILKKGSLQIRGYLAYTKTWGQRSVNLYLLINYKGKTAFFNGQRQLYSNLLRKTRSGSHFRQYRGSLEGFNIRVDFRKSRTDSYYSVWVDSKLGNARGCSGLCCNQHTKQQRVGSLKSGNPNTVKFSGRCKRKTTAYRKCSYGFRFLSGAHRRREVRKCVNARRNL